MLERAREIPDTANSATEIEKSTEHRHNKRLFPSYEGYFAFAGKQTNKKQAWTLRVETYANFFASHGKKARKNNVANLMISR